MRLYLSSYGVGDHGDRLATMVRGRRRGWVVMNALDGLDGDRRRLDLPQQIAALAGLDLEVADLDLRALTPDTVRSAFGTPDVVWVRGGNVFTLRAALARSGLDEVLREGLAHDRFVYAGYSAGPCVLAPSLEGLQHCDPTDVSERVYGEVRYDGLGVLDRPVVPHLDSPDHPETALLGEVADAYDATGQPYWALRDGEAMVVDGGRVEVLRNGRPAPR